jgi:hypothetical protein
MTELSVAICKVYHAGRSGGHKLSDKNGERTLRRVAKTEKEYYCFVTAWF